MLIVLITLAIAARMTRTVPISLPTATYPVGTLNSSEPSGYGPPSPSSLPGYVQSYVNDFTTNVIPKGWVVYTGVPGGDPGAQFGPKHVKVKNGELLLTTYRDRAYQNRWVTGGICQCGLSSKYGAYFVRSRATGVGPNEVELLWPSNNQWPPEIDFNETPSAHATTATLHWNFDNHIQQWVTRGINTLAWHTWGVVWSPKEIDFTLDGRIWGVFANAKNVPNLPMILVLEQRTACFLHAQCPTVPVQMQVDWVAEYHTK
jgi:hypothetical protein